MQTEKEIYPSLFVLLSGGISLTTQKGVELLYLDRLHIKYEALLGWKVNLFKYSILHATCYEQ